MHERIKRLQDIIFAIEKEVVNERIAYLKGIVMHIPLAILIVNSQGIIIVANQSLATFLGYQSSEELEHTPLTKIIPERYREKHREGFQKFIERDSRLLSYPRNFPALKADGSEVEAHILVTSWKQEGEVYVSASLQPVNNTSGVKG